MTQVGFYHCTRSKPFDVVPVLAGKAIEAGHKLAVHASDDTDLDALDRHLWTYDAASFLPHGRDNAAMQPVLLTDGFEPANGADVLICVGGKLPGDASAFARVLYLFDGGDADAVKAARAHWRALSGKADVEPVYWTQGDRGGWQKAG